MRILAAAAFVGAGLASSQVIAADLSGPPPETAAPLEGSGPLGELGSNWYIRGDVGYGYNNEATVVPSAGLFPTIGNQPIGDAANPVSVTRGNNKNTMGPSIDLGFGYRVNDWFRAEATWTFSTGPGLGYTNSVYCPEVANAVSNYNYSTGTGVAVPVGYAYSYNICDGKLNATQYNNTALAMGYFDLGHWGIVSPYIGAGLGLNANSISGTLTYTQRDTGTTYAGAQVNGSAPAIWMQPSGQLDQGGNPIYTPLKRPAQQSGTPQSVGVASWNRSFNSTKYTIAASAAAGLGFQISQSATLDIGYHVTTLDLFGGTKSLLQSIKLGVRYQLN